MLKSSKVILAAACLLGLNAGVALAGSPVTIPNGTVGTPYSVDLAVATDNAYGIVVGNLNGLTTYAGGGTLPPGEFLFNSAASPFDLILSGTPTVAGTYDFSLAIPGAYLDESGVSFYGFSETVVGGGIPAAPEPATWALMLAGFVGVSIVGVRRTSAAKRLASVA